MDQRWVKYCLAFATMVLATITGSAAAQQQVTSGAVFALIDKNEWCPAGSVYLDMATGKFMLHPRVARPACNQARRAAKVEIGTLAAADLEQVRSAYRNARLAGLRRNPCELIITNGGHEVLTITAPGYSIATPDEEGCWSEEAVTLHKLLFTLFSGEPPMR